MKMNKILAGLVAVASIFATSSCSEDDSYTPAEPETGVKPYVYFSEKNETTFSLEPTAPAELTFTVCRQDTKDAIEMPLIVTENTSNVFNVPSSVSFAAGEESVDVTVTFPDAPIGTPCILTVGFSSEYTGIYYSAIGQQTFTVNRVKWNSLGVGTMYEDFIMEDEVPVEILQRDDKPTLFRIVKPFNKYSNLREAASEYIEVTILQPKDVVPNGVSITEKNLVYFSNTNTGYWHSSYSAYIMMYHPGLFTKYTKDSDFEHNKILSYQEDGKTPGQIQLAPYYYMDGVGGWDYTQDDNIVIITFPGFVPKYEANIETDFDYDEEIADGEFKSGLLGKSSTVSLYVGTCTETKDDCDKVFEEKYGKIYKLYSPYAEDYILTFFAKDGSVSVPEGDEYALQATGLQSLGQDVYAKINGDASSYEDGKLVLNITFTNGDKKNEIIYGTYDEVLENVLWEDLGEGQMVDDIIIPLYGQDPVVYNVMFQTSAQKPGIIRVVDPFGPDNYPYYRALVNIGCTMPEAGATLYINCEDPDGVYIEKQSLNLDLGDGPIDFISLGADFIEQGYSFSQIKAAGYFGKYDQETGMITFPTVTSSSGRDFQGYLYEAGDLAYYAGMNGEIAFKLPTKAAELPAAVAAPAVSNLKKIGAGHVEPMVQGNRKSTNYVFTVRKEGKAPVAKRSKDFAPSQIETLKF